MCQAVKGSDRKNLVVCRKIIVFKCEIETRRMDILCIFVSAEKLNFILNPFTPSPPFDVKNFTGRFKIQNFVFVVVSVRPYQSPCLENYCLHDGVSR